MPRRLAQRPAREKHRRKHQGAERRMPIGTRPRSGDGQHHARRAHHDGLGDVVTAGRAGMAHEAVTQCSKHGWPKPGARAQHLFYLVDHRSVQLEEPDHGTKLEPVTSGNAE